MGLAIEFASFVSAAAAHENHFAYLKLRVDDDVIAGSFHFANEDLMAERCFSDPRAWIDDAYFREHVEDLEAYLADGIVVFVDDASLELEVIAARAEEISWQVPGTFVELRWRGVRPPRSITLSCRPFPATIGHVTQSSIDGFEAKPALHVVPNAPIRMGAGASVVEWAALPRLDPLAPFRSTGSTNPDRSPADRFDRTATISYTIGLNRSPRFGDARKSICI